MLTYGEPVPQVMSLRKDTAKYTLNDVIKEVKEDIALLMYLGYADLEEKAFRVKFGKALKKYGTCQRLGYRTDTGKITYEITINKKYLEVANSEDVHNTIMHECIHAINNCMNHGERWKEIAHRVNKHYIFTPIERCGNDENYAKFLATKSKYSAICKNCHQEWHWLRKCQSFELCKNGNGRCPFCGGHEFYCEEK